MQKVPKNMEVDNFVISHRHPELSEVISEKETLRNYQGPNWLWSLDQQLYDHPLTEKDITDMGWEYIEKPNTIGDMEVFNQWTDDYDYNDYDMFLITHDDNLILNTDIYSDVFSEKLKLHKPIVESRYGPSNHQFKTELVLNELDWEFLDNGYSEYIPKAFTPRGSFSFYSKSLISKLPNNKFPMNDISLTRENKTDSPGYDTLSPWNTNAGNFRDFLYSDNFIESTRWLSDTKRVSKYCIEGERGFIHNNQSNENHYESAVHNIIT